MDVGGFPIFTPSDYQEMIIHFLFRFKNNTNATATIAKTSSKPGVLSSELGGVEETGVRSYEINYLIDTTEPLRSYSTDFTGNLTSDDQYSNPYDPSSRLLSFIFISYASSKVPATTIIVFLPVHT